MIYKSVFNDDTHCSGALVVVLGWWVCIAAMETDEVIFYSLNETISIASAMTQILTQAHVFDTNLTIKPSWTEFLRKVATPCVSIIEFFGISLTKDTIAHKFLSLFDLVEAMSGHQHEVLSERLGTKVQGLPRFLNPSRVVAYLAFPKNSSYGG